MLKSAYEGLNARPKVYLSKEYFCEMYPTCVSSKLCEFIPYLKHHNSFNFRGVQIDSCKNWCICDEIQLRNKL